jgi:prenyltransferase beta subunit
LTRTETVDFQTIIDYLGKRRKMTGGYGATPRLPATIEDTFLAIGISRYLTVLAPGSQLTPPPVADQALRDYLRQVQAATWPGLRTTSQLLTVCRFLGLPLDSERSWHYMTHQPGVGTDLLPTSYGAEICRLLLPPRAIPSAWSTVPLPARLTVAALHHYLLLLQWSGHRPPAELDRFIPWLLQSQNGDGGFGFFPGTTSFIENCHHALASLRLLGAAPTAPEKARQFIVFCQTASGGFSRNPRAAPFLDATWHGLAALCSLLR